MADPNRKVRENAPGEFFVDSTCINCDTCRQLAPASFDDAGPHSFVARQPETPEERRAALHALLSCPTASIGGRGAREAMQDFPLPLDGPVHYCGFNSPDSYGGNSYFVRDPGGNWLVDSPRFVPHLVRRFHELGGLAWIFLTHRDDVADAARFAAEFGARRVIHRDDLSAQPDAEVVLEGRAPVDLAPGFTAVPVPGHTRGHCCLLVRGLYLFTGDHLQWDRDGKRLDAYSDYCWYSWKEQVRSMRDLAGHPFEWVLPGHGQKVNLDKEKMKREMDALVRRMEREG